MLTTVKRQTILFSYKVLILLPPVQRLGKATVFQASPLNCLNLLLGFHFQGSLGLRGTQNILCPALTFHEGASLQF